MYVRSLLLPFACVLAVVSALAQGGGKPIACSTVQSIYDCYSAQCVYPQACVNACYQALNNCFATNASSTCYDTYYTCQNKCFTDSPCRQCCKQAGVTMCHTRDAAACCSAVYGQCSGE